MTITIRRQCNLLSKYAAFIYYIHMKNCKRKLLQEEIM